MQYKLEQRVSEYVHGTSETFSLYSIYRSKKENCLDCLLLFYFFSVLQLEKDRDKCGCIFRGLQQPQVEGVYPGS